jgi:hypothetical protein
VKPVSKTSSTNANNAAAILETHRFSLVIPASSMKLESNQCRADGPIA